MRDLRRATLGWLRAVLAPSAIVAIVATLCVVVAVASIVLHYVFVRHWSAVLSDFSPAIAWANASVSMLTGLYGLMRAATFHPALDYRYHEWLKATPWTPDAPLPKGPITPVWQDGVVLLLATLFTTSYADQTSEPTLCALGPTIALAAGLALGWSLANLVTRNLAALYATVITPPLVAMLLEPITDVGFVVGLVAAAMVAYWGVLKGLRGYPWQVFPRDKTYLKRVFNPRDQRSVNWQLSATVGWPYAQLLQPPKDLRVSRWRAAAEASIFAIWIVFFGRLMPAREHKALWFLLPQFAIFLGGAKLLTSAYGLCPKLCLGERFAKRRPIVWRHDRLLLEALAIPAGMGAVATVWWGLGWYPHWSGAAATAAVGVWLVRRVGRPTAEAFYTGPQMVAGVNPQQAHFRRLASPGE